MKLIEDECVDCGLPCLGSSCKYKNVERFYCDKCGEEDVLYEYDGLELCIECIKGELSIIEGSGKYA